MTKRLKIGSSRSLCLFDKNFFGAGGGGGGLTRRRMSHTKGRKQKKNGTRKRTFPPRSRWRISKWRRGADTTKKNKRTTQNQQTKKERTESTSADAVGVFFLLFFVLPLQILQRVEVARLAAVLGGPRTGADAADVAAAATLQVLDHGRTDFLLYVVRLKLKKKEVNHNQSNISCFHQFHRSVLWNTFYSILFV